MTTAHEHLEYERRFDRIDAALEGITQILVTLGRIEERHQRYEEKFSEYDRLVRESHGEHAQAQRTSWVVGNIERVIWLVVAAGLAVVVGLVSSG